MKFKRRDWVHMYGCIIEVIEDTDKCDAHGEVVRITDDAIAAERGLYIGLIDDWEVIDKEPMDYESKMFWKLEA